jgi:hypothetical protein
VWSEGILPARRNLSGLRLIRIAEEAGSIGKMVVTMGKMRRAIAREVEECRTQDRFASTPVVSVHHCRRAAGTRRIGAFDY